MSSFTRWLRGVAVVTLVVFVHSLVLSVPAQAQSVPCNYNKEKPSIESARLNFRITNYACAEEELAALLAREDLDLETRADAHVLLAAVYYAKVRNNDEKRNRVIEQFVAAFRAFRTWRGELDIKSPEFTQLMEEAQRLVDEQSAEEAVEETAEPATEAAVEPDSVVDSTEQAPLTPLRLEGNKKPWYKKWWAIGLGVGLVAGAVVLATGGGDDDGGGTTDGDLPGFPPTPDQ